VKAQRLAKLQALLARVQSRSREPQRAAVGGAPAAPPAPPPPVIEVREAVYDDSVDLPTWPPPPLPSAPPVVTGISASSEPEISIDVEISEPPPPMEAYTSSEIPVSEAVIVDGVLVPAEEVAGALGSESVERLVVAPASIQAEIQALVAEPVIELAVPSEIPSEPEVEALAPPMAQPVARSVEVSPEEPAADALEPAAAPAEAMESEIEAASIPPEEEVPRAPASSRRPVALPPDEPIADMAFGADERPPRHTPPPESGRLPASPVEEFDADVTGVRAAPQAAQGDEIAGDVVPPAAKLVPEVTRAVLTSATEGVTDVIGQAQSFAPSTFAAWLDATLGL
jgi:hypothetical protein